MELAVGEAKADRAHEERLREGRRVGHLAGAGLWGAGLRCIHELLVVVVELEAADGFSPFALHVLRIFVPLMASGGDDDRAAAAPHHAVEYALRAYEHQAVVAEGVLGMDALRQRRRLAGVHPRELDGARALRRGREGHLDLGAAGEGGDDGVVADSLHGDRRIPAEDLEGGVGVVDGHVADGACAVVPPAAPLEGGDEGRAGMDGTRTQPDVPGFGGEATVEGAGGGIALRSGRPEASGPVGPAHHFRHFADDARFCEDAERLAARMVLVAHLRHHAGALLLGHEHSAFLV